jgi:hypothetical protein
MAHTMAREARRHDEDVDLLNKQLSHLQTELAAACREKTEVDARLVELDELVAQLLALNEALVAKLSGKPMKKSSLLSSHMLTDNVSSSISKSKTTTKKTTKKPVNGSAVPRAATTPTAASEAGKVQKYDLVKHLQSVHIDPADIDHLTMMHNMYRGLAKTIQGKSKTVKGKTGSPSVGAGSGGKQQTRMSRKKQLQKSQPGADITARTLDDSDVAYDRSINMSSSFVPTSSQNGSSRKATSLSPARTRVVHTSSLNNSMNSKTGTLSRSGLQDVIGQLEDEFDALNGQYRKLIHDVSSSDGASAGYDASLGSEPAVQSDELINVIQAMHRKEDQLRSLKSTIQSSR